MNYATIAAAMGPHYAKLGYRRGSVTVYRRTFADGVTGLILHGGFVGRGAASLSPRVGVHHAGIERILQRLVNYRAHPYLPPSVDGALHDLLPNRVLDPHDWPSAWLFDDKNIESQSERLAADIRLYGLPYIERNLELSSVLKSLLTGTHLNAHFRVPIVMQLLGGNAKAETYIQSTLDAFEGRVDGYAESFRTFAQTFLAGRSA